MRYQNCQSILRILQAECFVESRWVGISNGFLPTVQISISITTCSFTPEELVKKEAFFSIEDPRVSEREGVSAFYKDPSGRVFHTYSAYARDIDMLNVAYYYLDLVPKGRDEAGHDFPQFWVRRH